MIIHSITFTAPGIAKDIRIYQLVLLNLNCTPIICVSINACCKTACKIITSNHFLTTIILLLPNSVVVATLWLEILV